MNDNVDDNDKATGMHWIEAALLFQQQDIRSDDVPHPPPAAPPRHHQTKEEDAPPPGTTTAPPPLRLNVHEDNDEEEDSVWSTTPLAQSPPSSSNNNNHKAALEWLTAACTLDRSFLEQPLVVQQEQKDDVSWRNVSRNPMFFASSSFASSSEDLSTILNIDDDDEDDTTTTSASILTTSTPNIVLEGGWRHVSRNPQFRITATDDASSTASSSLWSRTSSSIASKSTNSSSRWSLFSRNRKSVLLLDSTQATDEQEEEQGDLHSIADLTNDDLLLFANESHPPLDDDDNQEATKASKAIEEAPSTFVARDKQEEKEGQLFGLLDQVVSVAVSTKTKAKSLLDRATTTNKASSSSNHNMFWFAMIGFGILLCYWSSYRRHLTMNHHAQSRGTMLWGVVRRSAELCWSSNRSDGHLDMDNSPMRHPCCELIQEMQMESQFDDSLNRMALDGKGDSEPNVGASKALVVASSRHLVPVMTAPHFQTKASVALHVSNHHDKEDINPCCQVLASWMDAYALPPAPHSRRRLVVWMRRRMARIWTMLVNLFLVVGMVQRRALDHMQSILLLGRE